MALLHRPQGDRAAVRLHRPLLPSVRILPDDPDAPAARLAGACVWGHEVAGRGARAGRRAAPRGLQPARGDARHDHDLPRHRAARRRRLRELPRPAADRRPRHGLPEAEHGQLLVLLPRRRGHAGQLRVRRRHRELRLDLPAKSTRSIPEDRNAEAPLAVDEADDPLHS